MIQFKDFVPKMKAPGDLMKSADYQDFDAAVAAANIWIEKNSIKVINMETVVLPNLWSRREQGTKDASIHTHESRHTANTWNQFLRVWYQQ